MKKVYLLIGLQVLVSIIAVVSFKMIEDRQEAGAIASMGFNIFGLLALMIILKWPQKFKALSFWGIIAFLFCSVSLSIYNTFQDRPWGKSVIFNMDPHNYHKLSEMLFVAVTLFLLIDKYRFFKAPNIIKPKS